MCNPGLIDENGALENVAARLKLLAEPMRLRLLFALKSKEQCVNGLVQATGASQANVSKHLSLLRKNGIITFRKEGQYVYYSVSDSSFYDIYKCIKESLEE